ncbi:DUF177 domain-containing protein [bacterium]|nr:DUF177 domain-containing protein [bacterium]
MKISLNTMPRGRSEQIFDSLVQLQQDKSITWTPLQFELKLEIDRYDKNFYLNGNVTCTGNFICESGMEEFKDTLSGNLKILLIYDSKLPEDLETDEIILIPAHQPEFDLYPLVREALLLAIPISHVCGPDCEAGKALQKSIQPGSKMDERWAKLKDMFNE